MSTDVPAWVSSAANYSSQAKIWPGVSTNIVTTTVNNTQPFWRQCTPLPDPSTDRAQKQTNAQISSNAHPDTHMRTTLGSTLASAVKRVTPGKAQKQTRADQNHHCGNKLEVHRNQHARSQ